MYISREGCLILHLIYTMYRSSFSRAGAWSSFHRFDEREGIRSYVFCN